MLVFLFIPDRLQLAMYCYELIHCGGGSCLLSLPLYYFSFKAPTVTMLVHVQQCYGQLQILYSVVLSLPADKWPGGEVQGESCQSQSALCCCISLRKTRHNIS